MSTSRYVCFQCGLPVTSFRGGWKHASGGGNPATPKHLRHEPVVALREEYERAFALDTPVDEARAIIAKYRARGRCGDCHDQRTGHGGAASDEERHGD